MGSVFSPYYALARRRDGSADPYRHCAINVALYGHRGTRWAMTERGARSIARDARSIVIGRSGVAYDGGVLVIDIDEICAPVPRRVRGRVAVACDALRQVEYLLDPSGAHVWRPLAPRARIDVDLQAPDLSWSGECYVDCNYGDRPLEKDFVGWNWSRAHLRDGSAIVYEAVRRDGGATRLALRLGNGDAEDVEPPPTATLARTLWGIRGETRADEGCSPRLIRRLEDAPFYARSALGLSLFGEETVAVHECLSLDRFVAPWTQMMLPFRMPRRA